MHSAFRIVSAVGFSLLLSVAAWAQGAFQNPPELVHKAGHLKAVIQLSDGTRSVPNGSKTTPLRMFQGWPLGVVGAKPVPDAATVAPGPTLRMRVGGRMDIMYLNKVDESHFQYTTDGEEAPGSSSCDQSGQYPPTGGGTPQTSELFPDCFHGSSTSNLHFHGTHTNPDGLGDNVLMQVIPNKNVKQSTFQADFDAIFNRPKPPQHWKDMPLHYQVAQLGYTYTQIAATCGASTVVLPPKGLVGEYDKQQADRATNSGRPAPESLWSADKTQICSGQWPQFVVGAFPNSVELPAYGGGLHAGQSPGTHWYHAHKHGSTSLHIFNGLAGALIIEGDYDDKLRAFFKKQLGPTGKLTEQVMVFQQIVVSQNLEKSGIGTGTGDNPNGGNNQKLINGKLNPTITMRPGEIQLWRLVNAMGGGQKGTLDYTLFQSMIAAGFEIKQVAYDGVQFSWENYALQPFFPHSITAASWEHQTVQPFFPGTSGDITVTPVPSGIPAANAPPGLTLAAGNRADILVKAPAAAGTTRLQISGDIGPVNLTPTPPTPPTPLGMPFIVLTINVAGAAQNMHFFAAGDKSAYPVMPDYLKNPIPDPGTNKRTLTFSSTRGPGGPPTPPQFTIDAHRFSLTPDGKPVSPDSKVDQCQRVNSRWDWTLVNNSAATNQVHPFHIHINPFQIREINYSPDGANLKVWKPQGPPIWSDTVNIPASLTTSSCDPTNPSKLSNCGYVVIRQVFDDFTGTYVLHCHILAHEDRGMMQLVRTIPEGVDEDKACRLNGVQHH